MSLLHLHPQTLGNNVLILNLTLYCHIPPNITCINVKVNHQKNTNHTLTHITLSWLLLSLHSNFPNISYVAIERILCAPTATLMPHRLAVHGPLSPTHTPRLRRQHAQVVCELTTPPPIVMLYPYGQLLAYQRPIKVYRPSWVP